MEVIRYIRCVLCVEASRCDARARYSGAPSEPAGVPACRGLPTNFTRARHARVRKDRELARSCPQPTSSLRVALRSAEFSRARALRLCRTHSMAASTDTESRDRRARAPRARPSRQVARGRTLDSETRRQAPYDARARDSVEHEVFARPVRRRDDERVVRTARQPIPSDARCERASCRTGKTVFAASCAAPCRAAAQLGRPRLAARITPTRSEASFFCSKSETPRRLERYF